MSSPAVATSGATHGVPAAERTPHPGPPDDTAPQPSGVGSARRSCGTGPAAAAGSGASLILQGHMAVLPGGVPACAGCQKMLMRPPGQHWLPGGLAGWAAVGGAGPDREYRLILGSSHRGHAGGLTVAVSPRPPGCR